MAHLRGFGRLLKMTICDVSGWHRYAILSGESIKGLQSVAAPLASDFCKSDHLHLSISHFWPFNVVKCCQRTAVTMALNIQRKNTASQLSGQTSQPNLQNEALTKVCFFQIGPAGTPQLLPCSGRNLRATKKVQLLQGRLAQDFQQGCGLIHTGVAAEAPGVLKRGRWGYTNPCGRMAYQRRYVYAIQAPILQKPRLCGG